MIGTIIFYSFMAIVFAINAYIYYKNSRVIKKKPILTNNQKTEFSWDFIISSLVWVVLCVRAVIDLVNVITNM